ncbi:diaminopimelate epimerase [Cryptosporangium phraense]|uniref:Diaminopimelate epimerase n=1 Tax=Cryptosporangium phraense TaxID=2593070 RepID=A0A545AW99_9ACTN|nr:diaminopimelate epimerase [Cryptosporangium phraense]
MPFAKGHGTENDFVIVPDPDGVLDISPQLVRALCDRRAGIGADGLLRVVRTNRIPEGLGLDGEWFMDYRNGDGSIAEMCGNGSRVFARYLVESGLARPGTMRIATRAGTKLVVVPDERSDITVDMGPAVFGTEAVVQVGGRPFAGIAVSMGNPHLVCGTALPVGDIDLSSAPEFDPGLFPTGVNVEVVNVLAGDPRTTPGVPAPEGYDLHVRMRVYERGSGETRSCGTGACAVAAVALRSAGKSTGRVAVDVPGGRVSVTVTTATTLLEGPAVLVGAGRLAPEWVAEITGGGIPATPPSMVVQAEQGVPLDDEAPTGPGRHGATTPRYAPADPADWPTPAPPRPTPVSPATAPRPAPAPPAAGPRPASAPPAAGPRATPAPSAAPRPASAPPAAGPRPAPAPSAAPRPAAAAAAERTAAEEWLESARPGANERLISMPPPPAAPDERPAPPPADRAAHLRAVADEAAHRAQQSATVGPRA